MSDSSRYDCKNCHHVFNYNELKIRYDKYGGSTIQTKVCPRCGSISWSSYKDRERLKRFLQLNLSEYSNLV